MRTVVRRVLPALLVVALGVGGWAWWLLGHVTVEQVTPSVFMLSGVGGNAAALVTGDGVVIVDTMTFWRQGEAIQAAVRAITDQPVVAILNTHYHRDHTHGNPAFAPGTKVVATRQTLQYLHARDADYWRDPRALQLLPNATFDDTTELHIGGKTIRAIHTGPAHTGGDLVVLFVEDRVVHTGDLFFNGHWPNIDLEAGGSVRQWPDAIQQVIELPYDRVIPGHGPLSDRYGWRQFQLVMSMLWSEVSDVAAHGGSLDDARHATTLDRFGLESLWFAPNLTRDFVIGRAYAEAMTLKARNELTPAAPRP